MPNSRKNTMYTLLIIIYTLTIGIIDTFADNVVDEITYPFRVVQISDTQPHFDDPNQWQRVSECIELVNSLNPDIVIFPGDLTYSGTEDEYKRIKEILSKIEAPLQAVGGISSGTSNRNGCTQEKRSRYWPLPSETQPNRSYH
ncbi:MAG: metallophosphoesterase [Sedimentisphaerales bacterium]|nr:metallophosphoesterase [Sedimentisphaerales bacterium]